MKHGLFAILGIMVLVLCGCQDKEAQMAVKTLNEDPRLTNRNVHVKNVTFTEERRDAVRLFDADILDEKGNVVGKAEGRRVEGFGTMRPRIEWLDPALADKSLDPQRDRGKTRRDELLNKADADGDGKVTYEEAVAYDPHMLHSTFDYLDRNGDGVLSKEDDDYKGPPRRPRIPAFMQRMRPPQGS